jgi:hypothetical protein
MFEDRDYRYAAQLLEEMLARDDRPHDDELHERGTAFMYLAYCRRELGDIAGAVQAMRERELVNRAIEADPIQAKCEDLRIQNPIDVNEVRRALGLRFA